MDWHTFGAEMGRLSVRVDYQPDIIVGITRGGIVPARLLSTDLHVKEMYCLTVQKSGEERRVVTDLLVDLVGKEILLVEDQLETGKSLIAARSYLEAKGARVKTACLYIMPHSEIVPDFYLRQVPEVERFPWE